MDHGRRICEVWADNLDEELKRMRRAARHHNYIAMDTEFPGLVVTRPPAAAAAGEFRFDYADHRYQLLRRNVDLLKPIQLGLTFANERGEYPPGDTCTWQFNFKFSLAEDRYAGDAIELLTASGVQFQRHADDGIETLRFAELLLAAAAPGDDAAFLFGEGVTWLSFHGGYDFGYLIKILSNGARLPEEEAGFFALLRSLFPVVYDVKYLMQSCRHLEGGLQKVAKQLEVEPLGARPHQAGPDSLLTAMAFFRMREMFFEDHIDDAKYCGQLYGLGSTTAHYARNGTGNAYEEEADEQPETEVARRTISGLLPISA